jgi:hypothetical protein
MHPERQPTGAREQLMSHNCLETTSILQAKDT